MKKLISILLVICYAVLCVACGGCNRQQQAQTFTPTHKDGYVYVCMGKSATKYHSYKECRGLGNCKSTIAKMPEADAQKMGRTRCNLCY